jgi:hypothetical protein
MNRNSKIFCGSLAIFFVLLIAFVTFDSVESLEVRENRDSENQNGVEESCGIMSSSAGLVQGGKVSTRKQFSWIVAITRYTVFWLGSLGIWNLDQ